ncbi:MAG: hypothetical protein ACI9SP_000667 [Arenicella sp.]|jgi:hypothetical protein
MYSELLFINPVKSNIKLILDFYPLRWRRKFPLSVSYFEEILVGGPGFVILILEKDKLLIF